MDSLLHAIVCTHVHYAKMQTDKVNKIYFSKALEEEVKDIEKEHQGLHLKLNNLVRNCQSIGTWNVVASKHLPPQ